MRNRLQLFTFIKRNIRYGGFLRCQICRTGPYCWYMILALLLFMPPGVRGEEYKPVAVGFGNQTIDPQVKALEKAGEKFVNLPFLNIYLHIISQWDPDSGKIQLRFGKLEYFMDEGNPKYTEAGTEKKLPVAPFQKDDQLWFPVGFLERLGIAVQNGKGNELRLDWTDNYLLGIETVTYQNRPAFLLIGSQTLAVKESNLLVNPDRLMIDFDNLKIHPSFDSRMNGDKIVKAIRVGERDKNNLRLVFDLFKLTGYKIIPNPGAPAGREDQQRMLVFNGLVEDLKFIQKGTVRKVQIQTSLPTGYRMTTVREPDRLFIDLEGVTLGTGITRIQGDGHWVSTIRIAQFDSWTVRVVLDLADQTPCYVTQAPDNPNQLEVRTVQTIQQVSWSDEAGGKLTIAGDSELMETINKLKKPEQLRIDLNYFRFMPGLPALTVKSPLVKAVRLVKVSETKARVEVDLSDHLLYRVELSDDHRRLVIHFRTSVLLKKVLVLDAGHGGVDPGTCGGQGTREKDFTLDMVFRLKELLEDAGAYVILTRNDDSYIGLFERPLLANFLKADLFISIHCNSYTHDRNIRGVEIYYWPHACEPKNAGKALADQVMTYLIQGTRLNNRGVRINNYAVLVETQMPGILVELGYLSNYAEETLLNQSEFKENASRCIFQGIIAYYSNR
jgi:N-acetylmuramoyl-L-alanine amidase